MKLLRLIFSNIRKMFCRRFGILLILILGIAVSSCAMTVYYVQGITMFNTLSGYSSLDKTVEFFLSGAEKEATYNNAKEFINANSEVVDFFSAMSVENENVDIIGINSEDEKIALSSGEWVKDNGIVVPWQDISGKEYRIGDKITIESADGKKSTYTVCGIYNPAVYNAALFSSRRISMADYAATGVIKDSSLEFEKENEYDYSDRNALGFFITYDDYVSAGHNSCTLLVRFSRAMSAENKENFALMCSDYSVRNGGDALDLDNRAMEASKTVFSLSFTSKFFIYIVIAVLGIVNILTLFLFVIKANKKQYEIFYLLGANKRKIILLTVAELVIYVIAAFTVGYTVAVIIINNSYLSDIIPHIGIGVYFLLMLAVLAVSVLFIVLNHKQIISAKGENDSEPLFPLYKPAKKFSNKTGYLMLRNYSNSLLGEIIIFFQIVFVAYSCTYALTYTFERGAQQRYTEKYLSNETAYIFSFHEDIWLDNTFLNSEEQHTEEFYKANEIINELPGLKDKGYIRNGIICFFDSNIPENAQNVAQIRMLCGGIQHIGFELSQGDGFENFPGTVDISKTDTVPAVISSAIAKEYGVSVGDSLPYSFFYNDLLNSEKIYDDSGNVTGFRPDSEQGFYITVEGILRDNARFPSIESYPVDIYNIFLAQNEHNNRLIYIPELVDGGEPIAYGRTQNAWFSHTVLYPDSDRLDEYRSTLKDYGTVHSIDELAATADEFYGDGSKEYYMFAILSVGLLLVGMVGYNFLSVQRQKYTFGVYYSCGMTLSTSKKLLLMSNAMLFLFGGAIGAVCGVFSANATRNMMYDSIIYSISAGLGFIVLLFCISMVIIIYGMNRLTPTELMKKNK